MWWWLAPALVLVVASAVIVTLTLTGADDTADDSASGPQPTSASTRDAEGGGGDAAGVPAESKKPKPKDRDQEPVTVALRQLDPCKVLDIEVAKRRGKPNVATIPTGPHSCFLAPSADHQPGDAGGMEVKVGTVSDHRSRYKGVPTTLAGAKAYQYINGTASSSSCRVVLPVSAVRAIELEYFELGVIGDLCPVVREYAEGTVAKLSDPDALVFTDTSRPYTAWDGCLLLHTALGETAGTYDYEPNSHGDPLGGCVAFEKETRDLMTLETSYTHEVILGDGESRQIAGKPIVVDERSSGCAATWDHGQNGNQNKWYAITPMHLLAKDCDLVVTLVEKVITAVGQKPPAGRAPQRPLLFGPDDNDTATLGACVDFVVKGNDKEGDCQPYQDVPVPQNREDIMAAANKNRHVQCAVFKDAVAERFGEQFVPVAWGQHCFFVDTEHEIRLQVNVDPANMPSTYGHGNLYTDREETEIAGKAAATFWDSDRTTFEIYLSPTGDIDTPGNLHIAVDSMGGRGRDIATSPTLPREHAGLATEVMTQVVNAHFR